MIKCEYISCDRPAEWHRPNAIEQAYNTLCSICFERIYHGFPHHTTAWEKLSPPNTPVNPAPTVNPVTQLATEQPTLF